jgi:hypothetical protein
MVSFEMLIKAMYSLLMLAAEEHSIGREVDKHSLLLLLLLASCCDS